MTNKFYITSTLPYVNAAPHIGFALEIVQADAIARFRSLLGDEVIFNTGTDEHGLKIYKKALEEKKDVQKYTDEHAVKFDNLKSALNLSYTNFIRTTDDNHVKAAQEFWRRCFKNGDIYKKNYKIKYCVGCELEKTESELVDQRCPIHPNLDLEIIEEENYFFRFSSYQQKLLDLYKNNPAFVAPDFRLNEIRTFVESGLEDFSISRLKAKMPWGVDVPDDPEHVMYVWFDALVSYISTLNWPSDEKQFSDFWPGIQLAGKDNLRQQSAMWQAMLMSAGLPNSSQIMIHGFITADGQKISKSLGNVIDPFELVQKYGTDTVRYYLLSKIHPFQDSDFTYQKLEDAYESDLANELGNLVSRITNLAESDALNIEEPQAPEFNDETIKLFEEFQFSIILEHIWEEIKKLNKNINDFAPWKKTADERKDFLVSALQTIHLIGWKLQPFTPETAEKIMSATAGKIKKITPLFPRK